MPKNDTLYLCNGDKADCAKTICYRNPINHYSHTDEECHLTGDVNSRGIFTLNGEPVKTTFVMIDGIKVECVNEADAGCEGDFLRRCDVQLPV